MNKFELNEFRKRLGERIRNRREKLGLTQPELAARLGSKDKQTISRYETEGANPTAFNLIQLADALELSVQELIEFNEDC